MGASRGSLDNAHRTRPPILRSAQATTVPRRGTETMAIGRRPPSSRSEAGVSQRFAASSELHTNDTWLIVELQPNSRASPSTAWRRFDRDQPWPFWNQWWRVGSRLRFAWSQFLGQAPPCWATAVDAIRRSSMRSRRLPKASNRMIPPLRMNAKGTSLPNIKVLGIDSWCPSSRLARTRSERYTDARPTSGRL
jgi:hypothetical protein